MPYWSTRKLLTSSVPMSIAIRIPYGIMVDINGKRFVDEGEDFFSYTYAKYGREVLRLPWRTAYQIFDSKTRPLLRSEYNRGFHVSADSIEALAKKLPGLDWENVVKTANEFNDAVNDLPFDPSKHDGKCTHGITSHQVELGAAIGHAAVLCLSGDLRHYIYLRGRRHHRKGRS